MTPKNKNFLLLHAFVQKHYRADAVWTGMVVLFRSQAVEASLLLELWDNDF